MKRKRRILCAVLAGLLLVALLPGCAGGSGDARYAEDGRIIVRVSMYNNSTYPLWRAYVENQCPDIDIRWENNRNSAANVLYLAKHDDMPDLIAIRRFEYDTASLLRPYLADMSDLSVTDTFQEQYLAPFADGGKQYWLPGPGAFDGIVANTELFTRYGIALPTDLDSFVEACRQLDRHNLTVFALDGREAWASTQIMEGFGASLLTGEGASWLSSFEAGKAQSVDRALFGKLAQILRRLRDAEILTQQDLDTDSAAASEMLVEGKTAMVRKTSDEQFDSSGAHRYAALPFFGETESDNWLCTYPVFSLAMSKGAKENTELRTACETVLSVMFSEKGQILLNESGEGLISYNEGINLPLSGSMESVRGLIEQGKCFIRVLNSNTFSANNQALTALIADGAGDEEFCDILDETLFRKPDTTRVASSEITASSDLDANLCSPSGSVVAQVLLDQMGADCAVIDVKEAPTTIYRGDYTQADISAVVPASDVYVGTLTTEELFRLLSDCVLCSTTFRSGAVEPILDYPALAGITVTMEKDGTVTGVSMDNGENGKQWGSLVAVSGNVYAALALQDEGLAGLFRPTGKNLRQAFTEGFRETGSLPEPVSYFSVK